MRLLNELGRALLDAGSMTWQITWSLILGFALSAVIQAVVRREAIARHLGDSNTRTLALASVREIDGTAHAVPFDAPGTFAQVITEAMRSSEVRSGI